MALTKIEIPYNGQSFFIDIAEGKMVNLNRIFEISGATKGKEPKEWNKLDSTKKLIESINGGKSPVLKTKRGVGGGTWAHWQLALSYAQYLSPELHQVVNQVFRERLEETIDPELGISRSQERARKAWKAQGKTDEWIEKREQGKYIRESYVSTLISHEVKPGAEVGHCTNQIYKGLFFKDSTEIEDGLRKSHPNLPKKINLRDHVKLSSLAAISLSEALSSEKIEEINALGVDSCAKISREKASSVRLILDDSRSRDCPLPTKKTDNPVVNTEENKKRIQSLRDALKGK